MPVFRIVFIVLLFLTNAWQAKAGEGYVALAGSLAPYAYEQDGRLQGISVDILREIMDGAGLSLDDIRMLPLVRGLEETASKEGHILLDAPRTGELEGRYKWVGPVHLLRYGFFSSRKEGPSPCDMAQQTGKFTVCAVEHSTAHLLLINDGFPEDALALSTTAKGCLEMLTLGKVELMAQSAETARLLFHQQGENPDEYRLVRLLGEVETYFAFSPEVDGAIIERLSAELDRLMTPDESSVNRYQQIMEHYQGMQ